MREDMFKVIVERPRLRRGDWLGGGKETGYRQFMASEDRAHKMGMRAGHRSRKYLNENLAPLRRFLMSCVGRPWNKVHSELLTHIDQRNTVQQHILAHVGNYVLTNVRAVPRSESQPGKRGTVFEYLRDWYRSRWERVEESNAPLFVDPRTGILRKTESDTHRANAKHEMARGQALERAKTERLVDGARTMRRFDDVWYEIVTAPVPGERIAYRRRQHMTDEQRKALPKAWDVLEKRWVDRVDCDAYVTEKRQLSSKEIVKFALRD
jgi:hypothetical protein